MGISLAPNCCCIGPGFTRWRSTFFWYTWLLTDSPKNWGVEPPPNVPCWCLNDYVPLLATVRGPLPGTGDDQSLLGPHNLLGHDEKRNWVIFSRRGLPGHPYGAGSIWAINLEACAGGESDTHLLLTVDDALAPLLTAAGGFDSVEEIPPLSYLEWGYIGSFCDGDDGRLMGYAACRKIAEPFTTIFSVKYDGSDYRIEEETDEHGLYASHSDGRPYLSDSGNFIDLGNLFSVYAGLKFGIPGQTYNPVWSGITITGFRTDGDVTEPPTITCVARDSQYFYNYTYRVFTYGFDSTLKCAVAHWARTDFHDDWVFTDPMPDAENMPPATIATYWNQSLSEGNILGQDGVIVYYTAPRYIFEYLPIPTGLLGGPSQFGAQGPTVMIPGRMPIPAVLIDGNVFVPPDPPPNIYEPDCADYVDCEDEDPLYAEANINFYYSVVFEDSFEGGFGQGGTLHLDYENLNLPGNFVEGFEVTDLDQIPTELRPSASPNRLLYYFPFGTEDDYGDPGRKIRWWEFDDPDYQLEQYYYGLLIQLSCTDGKVSMPNEALYAVQEFRGRVSEGFPDGTTTITQATRSLNIGEFPDTSDTATSPGAPFTCGTTFAGAFYNIPHDIEFMALDPEHLVFVGMRALSSSLLP